MKPIKFRASKVNALMGQGNELTEKQLALIASYLDRQNKALDGQAKPLTASMEKDLKDLQEKKAQPFKFGKVAESMIKEMFRLQHFGYKEEVLNSVLLKGKLTEQDCIELISLVWPENEFREKNTQRLTNKWITGELDILLKTISTVEDVKSCWSLKTFMDVEAPDQIYIDQAQSYLWLANCKKFRLHYCLVPTPERIINSEIRRMSCHFGGPDKAEESDYFTELRDQIIHNNDVIKTIAPEDRVKTFLIDRDNDRIKKIKHRCTLAQELAKAMVLNNTKAIQPKRI